MKRAALISAVLSCLVTGEAEAITGNELWEHCQKDLYFDQGYCHGYIQGVLDGAFSQLSCLPRDVTAGQASAVVIVHLSGNPQILHMGAHELIHRALTEAWPCKEE